MWPIWCTLCFWVRANSNSSTYITYSTNFNCRTSFSPQSSFNLEESLCFAAHASPSFTRQKTQFHRTSTSNWSTCMHKYATLTKFCTVLAKVLRSNRHGSVTCPFSAFVSVPVLVPLEQNHVSYDVSVACKSNFEQRDYPNNSLSISTDKEDKNNITNRFRYNCKSINFYLLFLKNAKHSMLVPRITQIHQRN